MQLKSMSLVILLSLSVKMSYAQLDSSVGSADTSYSIFLIFENIHDPVKKRTYQADSLPNFLQTDNNQGLINYNIRNFRGFLEGDLQEINSEQNEANSVTRFYMIGKDRSNGVRMSFEVMKFSDGSYKVHYYRKLGERDYYFKAHEASAVEIEKIKNYFK
jgi:hypothetical protein